MAETKETTFQCNSCGEVFSEEFDGITPVECEYCGEMNSKTDVISVDAPDEPPLEEDEDN